MAHGKTTDKNKVAAILLQIIFSDFAS